MGTCESPYFIINLVQNIGVDITVCEKTLALPNMKIYRLSAEISGADAICSNTENLHQLMSQMSLINKIKLHLLSLP